VGNFVARPVLRNSAAAFGACSQSVPIWADIAAPMAMLALAGVAALIPAVRAAERGRSDRYRAGAHLRSRLHGTAAGRRATAAAVGEAGYSRAIRSPGTHDEEPSLEGVGGGRAVAGQAAAQRGADGVGQYQQGGLVVAQAGDGELAEWAGVGRQRRGGVVVHADAAGLVSPALPRAMAFQVVAGRTARALVTPWSRARRVMNPMPRSSSSASTAWVVSLESKISSAGSLPVTWCRWSAKAMTSEFWLALDRSAFAWRVWVPAPSAKKVSTLLVRWGAAPHVVLSQHRVVTPVHDGVEVQVQRLAVSQPGTDYFLVKGGQERSLLTVLGPAGVGGQRGRLRQVRPGRRYEAGTTIAVIRSP
jgi:hypothetical protein